jgi:RND family efflux transporter MFP subunit
MLEASSWEAFARAWLILQCTQIAGATRGVLVMGPAEQGPYVPVSSWPEGRSGSLGLTTAAELALQERRGILRNPRQETLESAAAGFGHMATPLLVDGRLHGVVAVELTPRPESELRATMRQLQWGIAWIELRLRREAQQPVVPQNQRLATALELLATCVEAERFQEAATGFVTELAIALSCERVSLGLLQGRHMRVWALSHSAHFSHRSNLAEGLGAAMDEAAEQKTTLIHPWPEDRPHRLTHAQGRLSAQDGGSAVCTTPLIHNGKVIGGLTLERPADKPFDEATVELCETVAGLAGPVLHLRFEEERWLPAKALMAARRQAERLTGPGHPGFKLSVASALLALLFFGFAESDYRVAADTRIEGAIQRVIVASLDGYISEAPARAGDVVRQGQLMARMDDRDLRLEEEKWISQREQYLRQYRDALAKADRAEASILKAQLGQAEAELALVQEQLSRTRVVAPFDGIVVSGDLSQSLGAPAARGDVLFEVAPLDSYRVILEVDEADMTDLRPAQPGELVLTGEAAAVLPFRVEKITPVSESREGRNFFRVEAKLRDTPAFLRPGMKGVGKIEIGERKLIWIWTHKLTDWLRLWWWSFWP